MKKIRHKLYKTKKGQPYLILSNGQARFVTKGFYKGYNAVKKR